MKTTALTILFLMTMAGAASAQLDIVWSGTYGGAAADGFRSAIPTSDGGFVAAGYTYSYGAGNVDVFVIKTDTSGDTLWTRAFGGPSLDYGYDVCETNDGAYVIAGYTMSFGAGDEDVYLLKLDSDGDVLWTRTYGGAGLDEARSVCFTSDGYIVAAGQTESFGSGVSDVYLLKVDADGDTLWTRTFGGAESDWAAKVCETVDGNYGMSGTSGSFNTTRDAYMLKVSPSGVLVWEDNYGSNAMYREDYGVGVCVADDGGMAATGSRTNQDNSDPIELSFLRVDGTGDQMSYRKYFDPFVEHGSSICNTADGGYLICGVDKDVATHRNDLFLVKRITGSGWVWDQTVGGAGSDWGSSIVPISSVDYIVAGSTESSGNGSFDGWLLKMRDPTTAVESSEDRRTELRFEAPSPNPFIPMTTMRFSLPVRMEVELAVYDVAGRQVAVLTRGVLQRGDHAVVWHGTDDRGTELSPGVYLARLVAGDAVVTRKIVRLN
jgi:hypothetical protein